VALSVFDFFTIGIGPSSSHTVGPMRAARRFAEALERDALAGSTARVMVELFGSLGATGKGHRSDVAVLLGLEGQQPETIDPDTIGPRIDAIRSSESVRLLGHHPASFHDQDIVFHRLRSLPKHPNGMVFTAFDPTGAKICERRYYSVGGGFVVGETTSSEASLSELAVQAVPSRAEDVAYPFGTAAELLAHCSSAGTSISAIVRANERTWRSDADVTERLLSIWQAMQACVQRGCTREGTLPGGLHVQRRAAALLRKLQAGSGKDDALAALDWVDLWALAVNEENAAGGRVVTAPTNGAAGVIPAVLHYYARFAPGAGDEGVARFLLTAGAIGMLYKMNASISGAEVGCQGEVGVACSMAAAGLAEVLGGTPAQVENAAEIGMEHNLGLTCDPIGGLVQIPCIERNAMGAVKAINAARIALSGDGAHKVSLDRVIATMRQTGADMHTKYKETARGGLAVNVVEC
jgi:L-serine dehydratase